MGGFFNDLFGKSAQRDLSRANKQATSALEKGYGQQTQRYDQAAGLYDPYVSEGRAGSQMYNALLGLGGSDAASSAYDTLSGLPAFQGELASGSNAVLRNLNARGMGAGGTSAIAGQRVLQENIGNWLNRYRDAGAQGLQASGQLADTRMAQGDAAYGYGATKAGQAVNFGNALAQSRNTGANNLIGLLGAGGQVLNAFNQPKKWV